MTVKAEMQKVAVIKKSDIMDWVKQLDFANDLFRKGKIAVALELMTGVQNEMIRILAIKFEGGDENGNG